MIEESKDLPDTRLVKFSKDELRELKGHAQHLGDVVRLDHNVTTDNELFQAAPLTPRDSGRPLTELFTDVAGALDQYAQVFGQQRLQNGAYFVSQATTACRQWRAVRYVAPRRLSAGERRR